MTISTKLTVLVVCVIAVPIAVTATATWATRQERLKSGPLSQSNYPAYKHWIDQELASVWADRGPGGLSVPIPEHLEVVVLDRSNTVVVSNIPPFEPGDSGDPRELSTAAAVDPLAQRVFMHPLFVDGALEGTYLVRIPRLPMQDPWWQVDTWFFGLLSLAVMAPILVGLIARSLNRSIVTLNTAADRIAQGDLDFELTVSGRDEIASLARSFDSMRKSLRDERDRKTTFLMAVSHDLKTPLTSINGYLEAIADGLATNPEQLAKYLSIAREKSDILESRLSELVQFVRMESGEWNLERRSTDPALLCQRLASNLSDDVEVFNRRFSASIDVPAALSIDADSGLVTRVFDNLADNAIRYTREGDEIAFTARKRAGGLQLII